MGEGKFVFHGDGECKTILVSYVCIRKEGDFLFVFCLFVCFLFVVLVVLLF